MTRPPAAPFARSRTTIAALVILVAFSLAVADRPVLQALQTPTAKELTITYIAGLKNNPSDPLRTQTTFSNMYLVSGGGIHSVALGGDDAVVLVDTKGVGWGKALLDKLRLASDLPVTTVIDTSPTGAAANGELPDAVTIVAHEATKAMLQKKGLTGKSLPNKTFTDTLSLTISIPGEPPGSKTVDLYHFGVGHSAGDAIVVFPSYGVAAFGELFAGRELPVIDVANGGSAVALPDTLQKAVAGLRDKGVDSIIPSRATPPRKVVMRWLSMKDLQEYANFTRDFLAATREAMAAGKTVDEAAVSVPAALAAQYKNYGTGRAHAYVQAIYDELKH